MQNFDENIVNEFVIESKEYLEQVESHLLEIEKDFEHYNSDVINIIFRAIHSIKGASGFLGFTKIGDLSHVMESLLSSLRNDEFKPNSKMIEVLLKGVDLLTTMFDDIQSSNQVDIENVLKELKNVKPTDDETVNEINQVFQTSITSFVINQEILDLKPKEHNHIYELHYDLFQLSKEGKSPVKVFKEISSFGYVLKTKSQRTKIDLATGNLNTNIDVYVLYSTALEIDMLEMATGLSSDMFSEVLIEQEKATDDNLDASNDFAKNNPLEEKSQEVSSQNLDAKGHQDKNQETIRIGVKILDRLVSLAGEMVLVRNKYMQAIKNESMEDLKTLVHSLDLVTSEMQESIMQTRMQPIANVFGKLPRIVRDLAKKLNKEIEIETSGDEVEIDKSILQNLTDPLVHIIRNSCDHGLEDPKFRIDCGKPAKGTIKVSAAHEGGVINVLIEDDGRGVNLERVRQKALENGLKTEVELKNMNHKEIVNLIMLPGFSTAEKVSEVSGRGVGMDVVKTSISNIGGEIEIESKETIGTKISLRLPLTLAILPSVIAELNGLAYAIPQTQVEEIVAINTEDDNMTEFANNQEVLKLRESLLPIIRLIDIFENKEAFDFKVKNKLMSKNKNSERYKKYAVVVKVKQIRYGLMIDRIIGMEEIVVKPIHSKMNEIKIFSGATVRGDGKSSLILDIEGIAAHADLHVESQESESKEGAKFVNNEERHLIFQNFHNEYFAMPLQQIQRIARIEENKIETLNNLNYYNLDNQAVQILDLDNDTRSDTKSDPFLLLPKEEKFEFGVSILKINDIADIATDVSENNESKDKLIWKNHVVQLIHFEQINALHAEKIELHKRFERRA